MVTYFTDTDTDITPAEAQKYGYKLISMPYSAEGKTVYPYVDFEKFDCKGFYDTLRGGVMPVPARLRKRRISNISSLNSKPATIFFTFIFRRR